MNFETLTTEAADARYARIDTFEVAELATLMNEADQAVPLAVRAALAQIIPAIEGVAERMERGGRLFYVGAGTPGRIGVLDASEIPPTFSTRDRVIGIMAGGPRAVVEAVEGAEDDAGAGAAAIDAAGVGPDDSVIGIAASGRTPFVIGAVSRARERGALGIGLSCNSDTELSRAADHGIEVIVGPEFVSGSTRLKAGTAQKLVLNMFSTIAMIRLGKTYGNLMVDVKASNEKLRVRATRIVAQIAAVGHERAREALEQAGYSVPVAVVALRRSLPIEEARAVLDAAEGRLRVALDEGQEARR
ncbi:N-acetylmuramic acid 6-phosphate etherase [Microbacterium lushaniae]|uniref:N-acetylmuramic acid 6-phosphate etherase n=1 Tax=Microbacterium lushaniae TaxID=2614639 RepID=A0A5J6L0B4_9MICO|nr:N-acetylmuramic acid 6-phosphate etherase [Microbacterium lushaniae]QEW01944.1 N-acetylmuramic acid 6-phosphate etherase [Microbacterium lushaniae]